MIRFGSRGSDLALCQSRMVAAALTAATGEEVAADPQNLSSPCTLALSLHT